MQEAKESLLIILKLLTNRLIKSFKRQYLITGCQALRILMLGPWLFKSCQYGAQLRGWRVPASLVLEDVVNLLKCLCARRVAQVFPSGEEDDSIVLESN